MSPVFAVSYVSGTTHSKTADVRKSYGGVRENIAKAHDLILRDGEDLRQRFFDDALYECSGLFSREPIHRSEIPFFCSHRVDRIARRFHIGLTRWSNLHD